MVILKLAFYNHSRLGRSKANFASALGLIVYFITITFVFGSRSYVKSDTCCNI